MSEKKRKGGAKDARPAKRHQGGANVQVQHIPGPNAAKPVVASSPGTDFPDVKFQCYLKVNGTDETRSSVFLRSTEHPSITHTAREGDTTVEKHLKHYVAVFDPKTEKLQVTEAKCLTVRSAIRVASQAREEDEPEIAAVSNYSSRAALTAAFGTKKSRKAVQSMAENRLLFQGNEESDNPISTAMLANVAGEADVNSEALLAESLRNKPLPQVNLRATEIDQVYSYDTLIRPSPASSTLAAMPIQLWIDRITAKKEVFARSRFAANRVGPIVRNVINTTEGSDPDFTTLQVLRYTQILLDLHSYVTRLPRRKPIPPVDKWPEETMTEGTPMSLLRPIMSNIFPDRIPKDQSIALLRTTILALTLHIPPPGLRTSEKYLVTEPTDISMDLAIDASEARKLFKELGCTIAAATEVELSVWGLEKLGKAKKAGGAKPLFAKLKFPLQFPKLSRGRSSGGRK